MAARGGAFARVVLPGFALALGIALLGRILSDGVGQGLMGLTKSPVSPVMMAILLGVLVGNVLRIPEAFRPGIRFCLVRVLRLGIVLLGLRLGLGDAGAIGLQALPVILVCVTAAIIIVTWFSQRLGVSARLGTLVAVGTGICGSTAIVALSPTLRAREEETTYAVACITLFGMLAMLAYPFLAHGLFGDDPLQAGIFLGTAVHDTAQVVGAGLVYEEYFAAAGALDAATVTKLVRNLGMLIVIPLLGFLYHRKHRDEGAAAASWQQMVPLFVLGFAAMSALRTVGDLGDRPFGVLTGAQWDAGLAVAARIAELCLGIAMAAVGLGTRLAGLRAIGARPMLVGLVSAVLVGGVSAAMIALLV